AARGPAAARNRGWRHAAAPWVAFFDDDVVVDGSWRRDLAADLASCGARVAGVAGNVTVPLDASRRPTDWERNVRGLESAKYITADFAFRRAALERTGGFDARFPRAYREDAELALRILADSWTLETGRRRVRHPVRPADAWISVRLQAGNADDVLMEALHGREWHDRATSWRERFRAYLATVACAVASVAFGIAFVARVLRFAWRRIAPGPRTPREIATMLATSAVIPFAATFHRVRAASRIRETLTRPARRAAAVLFDRDGTLIEDVPDLRDPQDVRPVDGARAALARLRDAGIACGVVTNQPRVGEGDLAAEELSALHARLDRYLGPFATIQACVHARDAGCACRKPQPGLVLAAAREAGADPADCVV
ncbi:MAG: HAD-IIIA family hydrolase, partial [Candidatus Eremiobacteraeota bacterium]|nr:HAD-IIIA family hydrolase [Candidatus Eremiobacteraeota bacterium]